MEYETRLLTDAFASYKSELEEAFNNKLPNPKDSKASEKVRKEGNDLFLQKNHSHKLHEEILSRYNRSAALAATGSPELASAYGNRSAFLLHIEKYKECIQDVNKALEMSKTSELKVMLLCRKVECLKKLGNDCKNVLEEAQSFVSKFDGDEKNKEKLNQMVAKVATMSVAKKVNSSQNKTESVDLLVTDNFLAKVSIRNSEKYGRHLVAQQNYNPGDIIFVEKLFSLSVEPCKSYVNCHHCVKTCWSAVPCDHCDWVVFCSQDCHQKAWEEYHDIECLLGQLLNATNSSPPWVPNGFMSLKIFIKAFKNAGMSIGKLRVQLEALDQCQDFCSKGFYKNGKFSNDTVESFYSLQKKGNLNPEEKIYFSQIALIVLIGLLKNSQLKNIPTVEKLEDLVQNEDMVFAGSLLIKSMAIEFNNVFTFAHLNTPDTEPGVSTIVRGSCVASLASLLNHSCCPNAKRCFTENGNMILYAVQPVKKNSQIFISYGQSYYYQPIEDRQYFLKDYNFECDCEACTGSWPALLSQSCQNKPNTNSDAEARFMRESANVIQLLFRNDFSKATLEKLIEKTTLAFKRLKQPSLATAMMLDGLTICITNVYKGMKAQTFGKCKKM